MLSPLVEELARDNAGQVKVVTLDVDAAPEIAARFGAQSIPLLLLRDGVEIDRLVGAGPRTRLRVARADPDHLNDGRALSVGPRPGEDANVFKVVVLGLDGSQFSDRAIPIARELAQKDGALIEVVPRREFSWSWDVAWRVLVSVLTIAAGALIVIFPLTGTITLTVVLVAWLWAIGVTHLLVWWKVRSVEGSWMIGLNGALSLLLGILIWVDFPSSAAWAIGLLVGIDLLFAGSGLIMSALAGRQLARVRSMSYLRAWFIRTSRRTGTGG